MSELSRICGYCWTNDHDRCRPEIKWYDKVWYCFCKTCKPQEEEEIKTNEEYIQEPIHEQEEETASD
jgi:hypothetical protein